MSMSERLALSGNVAFVGVAIVFIILVLLIGVIGIMKLVFVRKPKQSPPSGRVDTESDAVYAAGEEEAPDVVTPIVEHAGNEDEETVAAIMAAITAFMGQGNGFRLRSIRRAGRNSPSWNLSGRDEYLATRL
jgi:sodium pump decarboxylase gamma subunit